MSEMYNIDDFPKLIPDRSIRFDARDEIRRSPEMDFECSELEYKQMVKEENELVNEYRIRLTPDTRTVMPDKNSLKHNTSKSRLLWLSLASAAAVFVFVLIITKDNSVDVPVVVTSSEPKSETAIIAGTDPEPVTDTNPKPIIVADKTVENRANIPVKKTAVKTKKPTTIEPEITVQDTAGEPSDDKVIVPKPDNMRIEKLERIASVSVPVEMMNKEKTVFVYQQDYQQTFTSKSIIKMTAIMQKLSTDVTDTKDKIFDGYRVPALLSRLSLDRGIDKEIDEWAKNNPDIPFTVFIDYSSENKMKEIYDENGTLIRVIFFTNKSLKYKNSKTYYASNNN
jgi:hypothetical protein